MPVAFRLPLQAFFEREARHPRKPFLVQPTGAGEVQTLTWGEVAHQARCAAHWLRARELPQGSHIALISKNCAHWIIADLAIWMAGHVSVPLYPNLTADSVGHVLTHSEVALVLIGKLDDWPAMAPGIPAGLPTISLPLCPVGDFDYRWADLQACSPIQDNPEPGASSLATIVYTSGTTGLPKAGIMKHGRWTKTAVSFGSIALDMGPDDVLYCTLPLYHATGLCVCWGSAIVGASGFAIRRKFSASQFWDDARKFNATTLGYVGELCRYLLDQPASAQDLDNRVTKMVGNGLRPGVWAQFKQRYGVEHICELYAASDGNIGFTNVLNFDNTIGFCLQHWALVDYNNDSGEPVRGSDGFMRKVQTGGQGLLLARIDEKSPFDGYTDPEKNRKVVLTDVFEKGDRYFNTGDLLRSIGFGHAQFVDRLGDTYRWKGENVSTTEVENVLLQHPQIAEVVAYGVEIENTNGRAGMVAITPSESLASLDMRELLQFAHGQLPHYAVPLFLRIKVKMETTGTFKYQKVRLKEEAFDPGKAGNDPVYAWLPGSDCYVPVTGHLLAQIQGGHFRY